MSEGWVYVLSNRSIKKQVKIGYSTISPKSRARDLDTTGVPTPFIVEYEIKVKNCELLEKKVHEKLSSKRVRNGREFFRIDIPTVISVIQDLADYQKLEDKVHYKSPEEIQKAKIVRVTESVDRKNVLEIKNEVACRVTLTHKKLSERINQLNKEFKKVSSGIAIFSVAKKDKEQKLKGLWKVNKKKLYELDEKSFCSLREHSTMDLIFSHLFSLLLTSSHFCTLLITFADF